VIEVAGSSLERDRTIKQRIYATAGISQYVIVNLVHSRVEVFGRAGLGARSVSPADGALGGGGDRSSAAGESPAGDLRRGLPAVGISRALKTHPLSSVMPFPAPTDTSRRAQRYSFPLGGRRCCSGITA